MRLGAYPATLAEGSIVAEAYGTTEVSERHRHRYEVNNAYRDDAGEGRPAHLRHLAGRPAGRVRRAGPRAAPVLRGHPGAPGAQEPADPAAPAVRRVRRGRAWRTPRPTSCRSTWTPAARRRGPRRPRPRRNGAATEARVGVVSAVEHRYEVRDRARALPRPASSTWSPTRCDARRRGRGRATTCGTSARSAWSPSTTQGRVVLVRQYRHPVGVRLWELPAGLMDVRRRAAGRGGGAGAGRGGRPHGGALGHCWSTCTPRRAARNELIRIFLARDLAEVPADASGTSAPTRRPTSRSPGSTWTRRSRMVLRRRDHQRGLRGRAARRGPGPGRRLDRAAPG